MRKHALVVLAVCAVALGWNTGAKAAAGAVSGTLSPVPAGTLRALSGSAEPQPTATDARDIRRPWYEWPSSTYRARPNSLGAQLVGIVIDLDADYQPVSRCTGTVVQSPNRSVVWTAAHCIFDRGLVPSPYPHIVFVPGAEPGPSLYMPSAPYGVWSAIGYGMTQAWRRHGSVRHWRRDFGALLIAPDAAGAPIATVLGGADRISFGADTTGDVRVLGYPATGAFAGNDSLIGCGPRPVGRYSGGGGDQGPIPIWTRCAMTLGASGGPWLARVARNGVGSVISVTSSTSNVPGDPRPGYLGGGVQDQTVRAVWAAVARRAS